LHSKKGDTMKEKEKEEIDLTDYLKMIMDNWMAAAAAFLIVFLVVLAYTFTVKPVYEAKSLILINSDDPMSFIRSVTPPKLDMETQKQIILSPIVMAEIDQTYLNQYTLNVNPIKNSNMLEITVDTDDGAKAALISDMVADTYLNYTWGSKVSDMMAAQGFISEQLDAYKGQLEAISASQIRYKNMTNISQNDQLRMQDLQRQATAIGKVYDTLLSKKEEAGMYASQNSGNVKIIARAAVPEKPIRPNIPLNILIGLILAFLAAFGGAYMANQMNEENKKGKIW
jgi:uncharacterized protein involved in exopolysaccharide biosynthesis